MNTYSRVFIHIGFPFKQIFSLIHTPDMNVTFHVSFTFTFLVLLLLQLSKGVGARITKMSRIESRFLKIRPKFCDWLCSSEKYSGRYFQKSRSEIYYFHPCLVAILCKKGKYNPYRTILSTLHSLQTKTTNSHKEPSINNVGR